MKAINAASLGQRIKQRRRESDMTQEVAAALCGISKKTLIKIEKGGDVYFSTLLKVLDAFGLRLQLEAPPTESGGGDEWF